MKKQLIKSIPLSVAVVFVLVMAAIAARITLFGILDASSWSGIQARYMLPLAPAFATTPALGMAMIYELLGRSNGNS